MPQAQKTDALIHNFQDPAAHLQTLALGFSLLDTQDQIFFFHAPKMGNIQIFSRLTQGVERHVFKL